MRGQENGADILRRADMALYEAKGQGRYRVCVET
jgi:PleD family two-component response regulator